MRLDAQATIRKDLLSGAKDLTAVSGPDFPHVPRGWFQSSCVVLSPGGASTGRSLADMCLVAPPAVEVADM